VAVPILSVIIGAKTAVVATDALAFLIIVSLAVSERRHVRFGVIVPLTLAAIAGMPIGLWALTRVDERLLGLTIAIVVIALTLVLIFGFTIAATHRWDILAGFISGLLATSTGTNGPPLVLALQARQMPSMEFRATVSAAFALQDIAAICGFALTGQFRGEVWQIVAVGLPGVLVGRVLGERVFGSLDQHRFRSAVLGLLLVTGVLSMLWAARSLST
jgi:uncharacterized protein